MLDYLKNPYLLSIILSLISLGYLYYYNKQKEIETNYQDYLKYFAFIVILLISFYYIISYNMVSMSSITPPTPVLPVIPEDGFSIHHKIKTGIPEF